MSQIIFKRARNIHGNGHFGLSQCASIYQSSSYQIMTKISKLYKHLVRIDVGITLSMMLIFLHNERISYLCYESSEGSTPCGITHIKHDSSLILFYIKSTDGSLRASNECQITIHCYYKQIVQIKVTDEYQRVKVRVDFEGLS